MALEWLPEGCSYCDSWLQLPSGFVPRISSCKCIQVSSPNYPHYYLDALLS